MRSVLITIVMAGVCVAGCNELARDDSIEGKVILEAERARLKGIIEALSKDSYNCEASLDHFAVVARSLVDEQNFGYKLDDLDPRKRARRDIQFVLDLCSMADSECARVLDAIDSNDIAMARCAAEEDYHGEYLKARHEENDLRRYQIESASMAISNVRKAVFFYRRNRTLVKYDDGIIGFTDPGVQEKWEKIIQSLDCVQTLSLRNRDYYRWQDFRKWHEFAYSNAVYRCEKRLDCSKSQSR